MSGDIPVDITKMFVFHNMDDLFRLTHILTPFYHGKNYLYKNPKTGEYYLVVSKVSTHRKNLIRSAIF